MLYSSDMTQLIDEVDHFALQKNSNIYVIARYNIKSLFTQIENMFIYLMIIL